VALKISGNTRLALLSSLLFFLEPLYAFFSRTAYPDIPMIFFALSAYAVFFSSYRLGPVDAYWLTGALLGLSVLSSESGIVFLFPLVVFHIAFGETGNRRSREKEIATVAAVEVAVSAVGLQLYDTIARTPFPTFLNQTAYMFNKLHLYPGSYGCTGPCSPGAGPFAWFAFFLPNLSTIGLSGNSVLLWLVLLWVPLGFISVLRLNGSRVGTENRLFIFAALLFGSTFLQDVLLYLDGQMTWVWHFLPVVPSLALGGAYLLTRKDVPNWTRTVLLALLIIGYFSAYIIGPTLLKFD